MNKDILLDEDSIRNFLHNIKNIKILPEPINGIFAKKLFIGKNIFINPAINNNDDDILPLVIFSNHIIKIFILNIF